MKDVDVIRKAEAFLFDFDGVVTDSEPYAFYTVRAVVGEHFGIIIDDEDIAFTIGMDVYGTANAVSRKYSIDLSGDKLIALLKSCPDYYTEYDCIKPFPYIPELFSLLKEKGKKLAIVSSTHHEHLKKALQRMDLFSYPDIIIGGDCVERRKPNPDPYLKAMEILGEDCGTSIAIEDSPVGILSAKRAGLFVLAYKGSEVEQNTEMADAAIRDYSELAELLAF